MPDSAKTDPYQTPADVPDEAGVSVPRKLAAVLLGIVVAVSAAATLCAFLFGLLVAVGGRFQTAPVDLSGMITSRTSYFAVIGGLVAIAVISVLLGGYTTIKILRASRRTQLCDYRRQVLSNMVRDFRIDLEKARDKQE